MEPNCFLLYFGVGLPLVGSVIFLLLNTITPMSRRGHRLMPLLALAGTLVLAYIMPTYYDKLTSAGNKMMADIFAVSAGLIVCLGTNIPPYFLEDKKLFPKPV